MRLILKHFYLVVACSLFAGCATTSHDSNPITVGNPVNQKVVEDLLKKRGRLLLETYQAGSLKVEKSFLANQDHPLVETFREQKNLPQDIASMLGEGTLTTNVFFHRIRHPEKGSWFINAGMSEKLRGGVSNSGMPSATVDLLPGLKVLTTAKKIMESTQRFKGVLLTNLTLPLIVGIRDLPFNSKIYTGPWDGGSYSFANYWKKSSFDWALKNKRKIRGLIFPEVVQVDWQSFEEKTEQAIEANSSLPIAPIQELAFVDLFKDQSVFVVRLPGFSSESIGFLLRTTQGAHLILGDAVPLKWNLEQGIEPGGWVQNPTTARRSMASLRDFLNRNKMVTVHFSRQGSFKKLDLKRMPVEQKKVPVSQQTQSLKKTTAGIKQNK